MGRWGRITSLGRGGERKTDNKHRPACLLPKINPRSTPSTPVVDFWCTHKHYGTSCRFVLDWVRADIRTHIAEQYGWQSMAY